MKHTIFFLYLSCQKSLTMNFAHCILIAGVIKMNTLGERLNYARKQKGYTQDSLAQTIGVSRGVIFNLEKTRQNRRPLSSMQSARY